MTESSARSIHPTITTLGVLAAGGLWLWLWKFVGDHTWTWGRVTFWVLLVIVALLVVVNLRAWRERLQPSREVRALLLAILALASVYLVVRQARVVRDGFGPAWAERLWDVSQGAYDFNQALLRGENPYATRTQPQPVHMFKGYSRDDDGGEYFYGWRYYYGYTHFPMSALWFTPFIGITGGYNDIRIGNLVYYLLNLVLLNAILFVACDRRLFGCLVGTVAFLGVDFMVTETFLLGIIDEAFSAPLLASILLAMTSCWRSAGVVAGLSLASKHFPAIPVVAALAIFVYREGQLRPFASFAAGSFAAVMLPFIAWDYEAFVSATLLPHLHEAGLGDNTALYFFLPEAWKTPFRLFGMGTIAAVYLWSFVRMKQPDAGTMLLTTAVVCLLINAFYPVTHLNHLESILAFASISFALGLTRTS